MINETGPIHVLLKLSMFKVSVYIKQLIPVAFSEICPRFRDLGERPPQRRWETEFLRKFLKWLANSRSMNFGERISMFSKDSYLKGRVQSGAQDLFSDPGWESITGKARGKHASVALKLMTLHNLVLYNLQLPVDSASHLLNIYYKQEHFILWKGKSIGKQFRNLKKCSISRYYPRLAFTSIFKKIVFFKETL